MNRNLFHISFPVKSIPISKVFYVDGLGCRVGRETSNALILNLYGHQIVAHITKDNVSSQNGIYPRHFGLIFTLESDWFSLLEKAHSHQLKFYQPPKNRFADTLLEHRTFFLEDPSNNLLEFKFYCNEEAIFGGGKFGYVGD